MSGANVIKLVDAGPPSPVDADCIAELERLLEAARRGDFNGLCAITVTSDNAGRYTALGTSFCGEGVFGNAHTVVGGCEVLKKRLLDKLFEWGDTE